MDIVNQRFHWSCSREHRSKMEEMMAKEDRRIFAALVPKGSVYIYDEKHFGVDWATGLTIP